MNNNIKSYGIDPYKEYIQSDIANPAIKVVADSISGNQRTLDSIYNRLINNIQKFSLNIEILRDYAENVYSKFADNSIDILRIDGNHDSAYVMKDLLLYKTKVKVNGIILMDDTDWSSVNNAMIKVIEENPELVIERKEQYFTVLRKVQ